VEDRVWGAAEARDGIACTAEHLAGLTGFAAKMGVVVGIAQTLGLLDVAGREWGADCTVDGVGTEAAII
jgi:hypothetical protein